MRLVRASEMQNMDRMTIEDLGIPGAVLMENAARGATRIFLDHFQCAEGSRILVLCGRGNNGGDGYVMARYLHLRKMKVTVCVFSRLEKISGDALVNLKVIQKMGLDINEIPTLEVWEKEQLHPAQYDYIIDGIFGTGLNSDVRGFYKDVIERVNESDRPVMSIDIPSGLNADTGSVMGMAIKAGLTVTFGLPKIGQVVFPGANFVGRLTRVDIGIPEFVEEKVAPKGRLIEPSDFSGLLLEKDRDIHKGSRGHLLILAGSKGKTGAAVLAALGAIRAGAGLVTVGVPESFNLVLEGKLTEAMTWPLPETREGTISFEAKNSIMELMEGKTALAIGPGLSTNQETAQVLREVIGECTCPMVIDADGLNILSGDISILSKCKGRVILTPHPGEMGRLARLSSADVQADRLGTAMDFASKNGCFLALKGAATLIAGPKGDIHINPTGNRALSSGGTGDVLTGLIGGFLARKWPMEKAAIGGVYLHGLAADLLSEDMGESGILASELIDIMPLLTASLSKGEWPLKAAPFYEDLYHPL